MAASHVVLALDALAELDRELSTVVRQAQAVAGTLDPVVVEGLRFGLEQIHRAQRHVRERVVASVVEDDRAWRDALLRTRTLVVLGQLQLLQHAEQECGTSSESSLGGRYASVENLRQHVLGRIARIHGGLRRAVEEIEMTVDSSATRRVLHDVALGKAEYGFAALAGDRELAAALRAGMRVASMTFAAACRGLSIALGAFPRSDDQVPELPHLNAHKPHGASQS